ncbi:cathepsin E [Thecamonas trahens ATCC 50062]|uniref:Cathepsin E n=1 Tax=Thecamonas trahens ATCC 50062 TaxID=461836 RepID=A0A0L0DAK8_THETB|nr:cathepsin E [Thecamonas trahens ATCC 50062]KNC49394.1 cathepsin E [Thecamonas trahens ATCC 50062]|eukprot:XP_013757819.1 cathepsin E [Thecamonas trahens ATCC 50062]
MGFSSTTMNGLIGMGFPALAAGRVPTFLETLAASHALDANSFAFYISSEGTQGELTLGGVNNALFVAPLFYVPLEAQTYWQIAVDSFAIISATGTSTVYTTGKTSAIVDSGTSMLLVPYDIGGHIVAAIGYIDANCSRIDYASKPDLVFTLGGHSFALSPHDYIVQVNGECQRGIDGQAPGMAIDWTLGCTFMRAFYTQFDVDGARVGFARAKSPA